MRSKTPLPALLFTILLLLFGSLQSSADIVGRHLFVTVRSEGCDDQARKGCGTAMMEIDNHVISLPARGHNILVFSETTGRETRRGQFDTHVGSGGARMAAFIQSIPTGSIVLVAVADSGGHVDSRAEAELRSIGAVPPLDLKLRETWALIGYKGGWKPWARQAYTARYDGPAVITEKVPLKDICDNPKSTCPGCQQPLSCFPCKKASCKSFPGAQCIPDRCGHCAALFFNGNVKIDCDYLRIRALSEGCNDPGLIGCGRSLIQIWGKDYSPGKRGHNIIVIDSYTGKVEQVRNFDTYGDPSSGWKMRWFLYRIKHYKIVVVVTADSADKHEHHAHNELRLLGAVNPLDAGFRSSWVLVSRRGGRPAWFRQAWSPRYKGPTEVVVDVPLLDG
eukprot:m.307624 g.307624  ORF g.307624 m.307624 type:complete len:392 (+) comp42546_c0_seq1:39-1214(+)